MCPNCPVTVPAYIELDCNAIDKGSIVSVAFIDNAKVFSNISNAAEWLIETYTASILIHKEVRGQYPAAAVTSISGYGTQADRNVGRNHSVTFRVPSILGNEGYWNALNKSNTYKFAFVTGSDRGILWYTNQTVSINAVPVVPETLDSQVDWLVEVKWSNVNLPSTSAVPTGTFTP